MTRPTLPAHRCPPLRPRLEALEDRWVPAFGTNGIVLTDVAATAGEWIQGTALQADGKIVVAGNVGLARYKTDGALDVTFNPGGSQPGVITSTGSYFNAVAIQADGKILAAGRTYGASDDSFLLRRYTAAGALDPTFGTNGSVTTGFAKKQTDEIAAIAIQPWDQKIIAVGYVNDNRTWGVVRYNTNGTLDTTFNGTGKVTGFVGKGTAYEQAQAVVVQADGKIVVVGRVTGAEGYLDFAVARYNPNGSLDTTFGTGGKVLTDFRSEQPGSRSEDSAYGVALQPDGKIVVVGKANGIAPDDFAVARYNPNGTLDTTFAGDGKLLVVSPFGGGAYFDSVALQSDGKIVASGGYGLAWVARLQTNGVLDPSFDGDGWQIFHFNPASADPNSVCHDVAIQPDGKILVVGGADYVSADPTRFALARLNTDGSFDTAAPLSAGGTSTPQQSKNTALDLAFEAAGGPAEGGLSPDWYGLGLLLEQLQKKR
ncbi:MAG: hypothetical protein U0797_28700 [Gemmataceae bacterium]